MATKKEEISEIKTKKKAIKKESESKKISAKKNEISDNVETKKSTKKVESKSDEVTEIVEATRKDEVTDIVKATKKTSKKKKSEDDLDSGLKEILSPKKESKSKNEDIISKDENSEHLDEMISDMQAQAKSKKDVNTVSISEIAKSDKELRGMDDIKAHFLEIGKKNDGMVKQDDIEKYTARLSFSDDDFDELINFLSDNGILIDSLDELDDEDDSLPPENENYDLNGEDEDEEAFNPEQEEMLASIDVKNSDPVRQYLHSIGTYQVFKGKDEEVKCAQAIDNGKKALDELEPMLKDIYEEYSISHPKDDFLHFVVTEIPSPDDYLDDEFFEILKQKYPNLKATPELYDLMSKVAFGQYNKDLLIQCNLKLVVSIAKHYVNRGMDFLDLIQEGNLGLMKAVEKFDYTKGFKFSTYATWWIRQAITRALADQARTIRIPVHMVETINKITRAQRKLVQKLNRDPTAEEISEELGGLWSANKIREIQQIALDPLSLEKPVGEEEDSHVGDFIEDKDNISPYDYANEKMKTDRINEVLDQLTEKESRIIKLRYGLDKDGRTHTLEEVGKEFNVTRERIRQIEAKALKKLRHPARAKLLKDFY